MATAATDHTPSARFWVGSVDQPSPAQGIDGRWLTAHSRGVTNDRDFPQLANTCNQILSGSEGVLQWAWDDYMGAALATHAKPSADSLLKLLEGAFESHHTADSVGGDAVATEIAAANGGLRPGQHLFLSDGGDESWLVGAWWPWGDGQTISLRVRLLDTSVTPAGALAQPLRTWFRI